MDVSGGRRPAGAGPDMNRGVRLGMGKAGARLPTPVSPTPPPKVPARMFENRREKVNTNVQEIELSSENYQSRRAQEGVDLVAYIHAIHV